MLNRFIWKCFDKWKLCFRSRCENVNERDFKILQADNSASFLSCGRYVDANELIINILQAVNINKGSDAADRKFQISENTRVGSFIFFSFRAVNLGSTDVWPKEENKNLFMLLLLQNKTKKKRGRKKTEQVSPISTKTSLGILCVLYVSIFVPPLDTDISFFFSLFVCVADF